jgi:hypothetical protein
MTAEVAIVNRHAIALAADSAVTVGRERVWKYANKLFSLGPHNDIGVMIYNSADFVGIPWETIVKEFRRHCADTHFITVSDAAVHFIDFIKSNRFKNDKEEFESFARLIVNITYEIESAVKFKTYKEFNTNLEKYITDAMAAITKTPADFSFDRGTFVSTFKQAVKGICKEAFKHKPNEQLNTKLCEYMFEWISRKKISEFSSGIVFAGYGREEFLPAVLRYEVDGRALACVRVWERQSLNYNLVPGRQADTGGAIIPFAQSDMLQLFMEGISGNYLRYLRKAIRELLKKKSEAMVDAFVSDVKARPAEKTKQEAENKVINDELFAEFSKYRNKSLIEQTLKTVNSLPKEEMAAMAEALVELTALRRKLGPTLESVGGPVDVAIISKGDGFIWIKRKHYFKAETNLDFSIRKNLATKGVSP